ncbi:rod-binding protein [Sulfitobacter mediterraneus]|jgi:peptidoglycan hydrolase FlgJ|uniref:rod-binding protein n=1 Tax=Sulfitobacter TaxID=60136 RepID=UPI0019318E60|nr:MULTISPECIES: rod-binding protein [Sulfitobacter]MBM1632803.1 rod-binding protein [Sulfitobacter mediterraneus]MBM1641063.1 rod-binding protein [Sulfitobacter mediterraneus]MBM1644668.1 rod-binding protein [Sulfitobacter mediterraneus]MBM1649183.1 rod-binding protein [Sulfitobacter mediterraneus]MBM1653204.1 rod-binding protein [Sulfitobacter mediterraneus]
MQILPSHQPQTAVERDQKLRAAAHDLETTFLAEMLKSAGLGQTRGAFGGGAGEDQFASFLLREQAAAMVRSGGIGLSETIFESLKERNDATPID